MATSVYSFSRTALVLILLFTYALADPCTDLLVEDLKGCLDYVSNTVPVPSSDCCTGLANVVHNSPGCLCLVFSNDAVLNKSRAYELPGVCKVPLPKPPRDLCPGLPAPPSTSSPAPVSGTPNGNTMTSLGSTQFAPSLLVFVATTALMLSRLLS